MNKTSHDSEVLVRNQQVITACAFIHRKFDGIEKVFLPKRAETKKFLPGVYELPGGHIDFGEDPVNGLKREINEEICMEIKVGDPFYVFTYTNEIKCCQSIEVIYFAEFTSDISEIKLNPEDHSTFGWFSEDQLINVTSQSKGLEDAEFLAMKKAFGLLNGGCLTF